MEENNIENNDSLNVEEAPNLEVENDSLEQELDAILQEEESESPDVDALLEKNRQLYARAKKAEEALKKVPQKPQAKVEEPGLNTLVENISLLKDLSGEEINMLQDEAKSLGIDPIKFIKSNSGKNLLTAVRTQEKAKSANVSISPKSPVYKKFTQDDLSKMSSAELEKILPHAE